MRVVAPQTTTSSASGSGTARNRLSLSTGSLVEQVLHDLLPDLMALHRATKHQRTKLKIEKYVERILKALDTDD